MAVKPTPKATTSSQRIIKKYPNRRLYDTETSSYVTLVEIKRLVMDSEPFCVVDAKTGDDLTRSILMQIILEEEASGSPMFTASVLSNIIRFYGHTMQGFMGGYLEKSMQSLIELQSRLGGAPRTLTPDMWMQGMMGNSVDQSHQIFTQLQEQMQKQTEQMLGVFGLKR